MGIVTVLVEWVWQKGSERFFEVRVTENAVYEEADDPGEEFALQRVNVRAWLIYIVIMCILNDKHCTGCMYIMLFKSVL